MPVCFVNVCLLLLFLLFVFFLAALSERIKMYILLLFHLDWISFKTAKSTEYFKTAVVFVIYRKFHRVHSNNCTNDSTEILIYIDRRYPSCMTSYA